MYLNWSLHLKLFSYSPTIPFWGYVQNCNYDLKINFFLEWCPEIHLAIFISKNVSGYSHNFDSPCIMDTVTHIAPYYLRESISADGGSFVLSNFRGWKSIIKKFLLPPPFCTNHQGLKTASHDHNGDVTSQELKLSSRTFIWSKPSRNKVVLLNKTVE